MPERSKITLQEWWIQNVYIIMHKPYGHLKAQERRAQSKNVQPSCSSSLMMLFYAVCCARCCMDKLFSPCSAQFVRDVKTSPVLCQEDAGCSDCVCTVFLCASWLPVACSMQLQSCVSNTKAYFMISYSHTCCNCWRQRNSLTYWNIMLIYLLSYSPSASKAFTLFIKK